MAAPRTSLRGFLAHAKSALRSAISSQQKVTLVIGNESADLDSMTCQILYAYVRSMAPPKNAFTPLYIPVTNMPAAGVDMRREFLAVFKHADIEAAHLITLDDLPAPSDMQTKLRPENTRWILVDHNALQGQLGSIYSSRVQGVIDHHDDEGAVPQDTGAEPRIIEKSGSCTSLVTNYVGPTWDTVSGGALDDDARVAQLGLASILMDTANLQDQSKTTEHDRRAVEYLEAKVLRCPQVATTYDRGAFYEAIDAAKKDIGALELQHILQKDYKEWEQEGQKLGISSVVKEIAFLQTKAGEEAEAEAASSTSQAFLDQLADFARERSLNLYSVMTTSTSAGGSFQRELLVWAFDESAVSWAQRFASQSQGELGLEAWEEDGNVASGEGDGQWRRVWWQREVQHSRKRVAPLLRQAR
ncbi:exopolyphosphatase [Didymella exigua CBS 183.55]|uniref:Exopolyphosphatase n=1 Tax=Didymella exigua CBS 183.55 TaxID=1150837 RepID=A0A6A5RL46_9PLEO|nr:exopolyphosphatase [Didymella exigua CBS 183.55]KAF1928183.1 exopolyphosphatase [Didymella exigua CBS 183.55]